MLSATPKMKVEIFQDTPLILQREQNKRISNTKMSSLHVYIILLCTKHTKCKLIQQTIIKTHVNL